MGLSPITSPRLASPLAASARRPSNDVRVDSLTLSNLLQIAFDLLALTVAWHLTIRLRMALNFVTTQQFTQTRLEELAPPLSGLLLLWAATSVWFMVSGHKNREPGTLNMFRLSESMLLVGVLAVLVTFFSKELGTPVSRSFILLYAPVSYVHLIVARWLEHATWIRLARAWPVLTERVAIVGIGKPAADTADRLRKTESGFASFVGFILPPYAAAMPSTAAAPILGTMAGLAELINSAQLTRLLVLNGCLPEVEFQRCSEITQRMGVVLSREVGFSRAGVQVHLENCFGMHLVDWRPISFTRFEELMKRFFDAVCSFLLLAAAAPLLLVCAVLIKLTSPGPVFYRSTRVGKGGRHFTFYKLRTMNSSDRTWELLQVGRSGHIFKMKRDPRTTPLGRILRRFSIDELPQLAHVLTGQMSLLGPRPLPAEDLDPDGMSRDYPEWAGMRALVKPGISGLWQVRGRSDLSFDRMIQLDLEYIQNWSLLLDLKILLATPLAVLTGRGAY